MEFRILGPLEVIENGRTVDLGGQKQRALLAMLLLHANEVVSSDRLIDALWEDDPPETAPKALAQYQQARQALVDELGIEPSRELRDVHQAILNQDPALDLVTPHVEAESSRGAFVGREAELGALMVGLDDAFAGRGRLFLLVGEPGIGKSRLAEELMVNARARGARILVGRCWEAGGAPAYWPWVQSLRAYVRDVEPEALRTQLGVGATELAQLLPEVRDLFPDLGEPPELEPDSARFRLFEAVAAFLRSA